MKKIAFLIRSLDYGGAEKQLVTLAKAFDQKGLDVTIFCFYAEGPLAAELANTTVQVISLHKKGRWDIIHFFIRLVRYLKVLQPDVIHGYLSDPNLVTAWLRLFFPKAKIVWGIRHSNWGAPRPNQQGDKHRVKADGAWSLSLYLEQKFARFADLIIANSHAGQTFHLAKHFPSKTMIVIPNGIDVDRFQPEADARERLRQEWGLLPNTRLVGLIGRLVPMKDHPTFLNAAALLVQKDPDIRFVCVGSAAQTDYAAELYALTEQLGLADRVIWAGARSDMCAVYNALDLLVSTSAYGEGFSNVIGEAMACGKSCVVTDVGDSAWIVGCYGLVIPPEDPQALTVSVLQLLNPTTGYPSHAEIRQRIVDNFSVSQLLLNTERALS